jgi:hypothetical protein
MWTSTETRMTDRPAAAVAVPRTAPFARAALPLAGALLLALAALPARAQDEALTVTCSWLSAKASPVVHIRADSARREILKDRRRKRSLSVRLRARAREGRLVMWSSPWSSCGGVPLLCGLFYGKCSTCGVPD